MTLNIEYIESDLKEIDADKSFLDKLDQKLDKLQGDMSGLRQQDIPNISVKLENLTTRMFQVEKTVDNLIYQPRNYSIRCC